MHSQTVEVATFADDVAAEGFAVLFWRIELAAADANVVAHGNRQGVHHVSLLRVPVLENFGQHIEEHSPEVRVYGVQPAVEATLGDRLWYVAILVQKRAARLDVAAEECGGHKSYGHHLGGRQENLRIVTVACGLQELHAEVVGGGYGIFQCDVPTQREGFRRPSDREDILYRDRGQLGLTTRAAVEKSFLSGSWKTKAALWAPILSLFAPNRSNMRRHFLLIWRFSRA